jgi:hypothetical protein
VRHCVARSRWTPERRSPNWGSRTPGERVSFAAWPRAKSSDSDSVCSTRRISLTTSRSMPCERAFMCGELQLAAWCPTRSFRLLSWESRLTFSRCWETTPTAILFRSNCAATEWSPAAWFATRRSRPRFRWCSSIGARKTGASWFRIEAQCPDFDLSSINSSTVLLVDGHFPKQAMRAVRRARECGAVVVADFHTPRPGCMKLLPFVDYPIVSSEFGTAWQKRSPRQTLRALQEQYGGNPVVTLGEKGAVGLVEGRLTDIPAARVRVRDTTGAGDAFHGGFAAGLCLGYSAEQSLHLASRAAAKCCTEFGATARPLQTNEISVKPAGRARK